MPWPKLLVLVRHAESEGNVRSIEERAAFECATHAYPLTERGRNQARLTGSFLKDAYGKFDIHYTSYYARAKETMAIMYPDARVYEDPRLAEAQRGIYHTYTHEEMRQRFPLEIKRKDREGFYHHRPLGGENWPDVELRIHSFLGTLARDCGDSNVLMVVHGHWLILFQRLIHHFSIEEAMQRYQDGVFQNASVTVYNKTSYHKKSHLTLVKANIVPWEGLL